MPDVATSQGAISRSTAKKLIQAAALAAALVPLSSVPTDAASITCTVEGSGASDAGCGSSSGFTTFDFGDFKVGLEFFNVTADFSMTVTDTPITQTAFDARVDPELGSYDCVPLVTPTGTEPGCRNFTFVSSAGKVWDSYATFYSWLFDSENNGFPNGSDSLGNVRVLQAPDESTLFTVDMCLAALAEVPNYLTCAYELAAIDPTVKSGDTRFSDQIVAFATPVPEPASIALLGTGLAGLVYRKRRNLKG